MPYTRKTSLFNYGQVEISHSNKSTTILKLIILSDSFNHWLSWYDIFRTTVDMNQCEDSRIVEAIYRNNRRFFPKVSKVNFVFHTFVIREITKLLSSSVDQRNSKEDELSFLIIFVFFCFLIKRSIVCDFDLLIWWTYVASWEMNYMYV